jgi:PAS domain S-box-containing protein
MNKEHAQAVCAHAELFDVPGHAVIATTIDGQIVYWSDHATSVFGWKRSEVLGRDIVTITPAAANAANAAEIMEKLKAGEPYSGTFRLRRRDGHEFEARVSDIPVRSSDGAIIGIIGVSRIPE